MENEFLDEGRRGKVEGKLVTKMHRKHKIFQIALHAALTGICRSGGLVDTLIRESIRISWVSANPCPHSGQRGIPIGSASISGKICGYLRNLRLHSLVFLASSMRRLVKGIRMAAPFSSERS
jgi:hypothetical protein